MLEKKRRIRSKIKRKSALIITKRWISIFSFCFCIWQLQDNVVSLDVTTDKKKTELIILIYKVRNCLGLDEKTDYQRVSDIITRINPGIVTLQELDSATLRSRGFVVLDELAIRTGMFPVYSPPIIFQGGKYGNGILSKEKPINWKSVPLPGREKSRNLLIVEFKDFIFCCTHFSLNEEDRFKSVTIINDYFKVSSKPVFLAGNFNAVPGSLVVKNIEQRWHILNDPQDPTIPAENPNRFIDYILVSKNSCRIFKV